MNESDEKNSHVEREERAEKAGNNIVKRTANGLKLEPQPSDDITGINALKNHKLSLWTNADRSAQLAYMDEGSDSSDPMLRLFHWDCPGDLQSRRFLASSSGV
jgi:hypothetical protein